MTKNVLAILLLTLSLPVFAQLKVKNLLLENRVDPIGIDIPLPRFSWQLISDQQNVMQTAYEIRMGLKSTKTILWTSGKQMSALSQYVPYTGDALQSGAAYYWQVRVWDNKGKGSDWSDLAYWQMGMLKPSDWTAKWIASPTAADTVNGPALLFRKDFTAKKKIQKATLYITSHGMYEGFINGLHISDDLLTPGWTSYNKRLQYQQYEVTAMIAKGANTIGVNLGSGWYRTPLAWENNRNIYGKTLALLAQLDIQYTDGSRETVITDNSWKTSDQGPIRSSELYDGEVYDARLEKQNWDRPGFNDAGWQPVVEKDFPKNNLIATYNEPVRIHNIFNLVRVIKTPKGEQVIDFGQNLVGWENIFVEGKAGDSIIVDHAEVLDKEGNFYTDNLRNAKSRNIYVLRGGGTEHLNPHFTFHGFRYIRVKGLTGNITSTRSDHQALHDESTHGNVYVYATTLYSDMDSTGQFTCSNPLLNQLQHNIQWGQKGNFLDVPTDCPQRDERLGWTGDAQAFSRTASYNMDVHNFFSKWMKDVAADQTQDGMVPFVVPNVLGDKAGGSAGWADVATIIPWNMWLAYGDIKILEDQYASMKGWVGYMQSHSRNDLWDTGFHFGDWLFYRPFDDNDGRAAVTDKYLIAQCFFAHSTQLLINAAQVLKKSDDVQQYTALLKKIKEAFVKEYVTPSGRLISSTQTAYVLALQFDMLPEALRAQAAKRLADNVKDYDNHLTTGFLGTPYLTSVLSRFGYDTVAFKLLMQDSYPSWLYPVKMGATTIWERWDGQKPDSSFQTPGMNSFNHYAYGAIGDWMYRYVAGIDTDNEGVGYQKIIIRPHTGGGLSYVNADLQTGYGKLSAHWKLADGKFILDVDIPANTTATIYLPASSAGGKEEGVKVGSGKHHFESVRM